MPSLWEILKWMGLPILLLAAAWGRTQFEMAGMATRAELEKLQQNQQVLLDQNRDISRQLKRLTCRLYPQSFECPEIGPGDVFNEDGAQTRPPSRGFPR